MSDNGKYLHIDKTRLPQHVAMIMDGNRRWAAARGLRAVAGHEQAAKKAIEPIVEHAAKLGIKFLTFYTFSTENWKRDKEELKGLFKIFRDVLSDSLDRLHQKGVKIQVVGEVDKFPADIVDKLKKGIKATKNNSTITVSFALNYGGREEILRAINKILSLVKRGKRKLANQVIEAEFSQMLDTAGMPDPDLVIRTGGERRLSGYFPWQSVYSELYFTPTYWPDFSPEEFDKAIIDFQNRTRRFGGGTFSEYVKRKTQKAFKTKSQTDPNAATIG